MTVYKLTFALVLAALLAAGCALQKPQIAYLPGDTRKYPTPEAAQEALVKARQFCSSPLNPNDYNTGMNAVNAARASNDEFSEAGFESCMAKLGFFKESVLNKQN